MTDTRITQTTAEVAELATPATNVTQSIAEVAELATPATNVSQVILEVAYVGANYGWGIVF